MEGAVSVLPGSHGEEQGCGAALHSFLYGLVGKTAEKWSGCVTPSPTRGLLSEDLLEGWTLINCIFKSRSRP